MEPHVTLHHFVHPAWFERLGGFAKEGEPGSHSCAGITGWLAAGWAGQPPLCKYAGAQFLRCPARLPLTISASDTLPII
jgi:hypothetical protein